MNKNSLILDSRVTGLLWFLIPLFLSSCLVGSKYQVPELSSPERYSTVITNSNVSDSIANISWFELFGDSVLNSYIRTAVGNNCDLKIARLRLEQAGINYSLSKSNQLPSIGYKGSASLNDPASDVFQTVGTLSWEIDFWGRLRYAKESAFNQMLAGEEGQNIILTTVASNVAVLYFQLRDLDNRREIVNNTIRIRNEYFEMIKSRFLGGETAELDMLQAAQQLELSKATLASIERELGATERSLNILMGGIPSNLSRGATNSEQKIMVSIPVGLPSDLVENRPDVRQAGFSLKAQYAQIGIAQAQRLPTINLTGALGFSSVELSSLFKSGSDYSSFSGALLGPIFEFGKNRKRVEYQKKEAEIAAETYLKTWLNALADVENALSSIETYEREAKARSAQATYSEKSLELSRARYTAGYTDYTEVLIAEQNLLESELQASSVRAKQLSAVVGLYKALGGGWR